MFPVTEGGNVHANWFNIVYYVTLGVGATLSSAPVVVVPMLYNTVANIIKIIGPGTTDHPLARSKESKDEE